MQVSGKVLVCDSIDQAGIDSMKRAGLAVDYKPEIKPAELVSSVGGYDVVIVRSRTKITKEVVDAAASAKVITAAHAPPTAAGRVKTADAVIATSL